MPAIPLVDTAVTMMRLGMMLGMVLGMVLRVLLGMMLGMMLGMLLRWIGVMLGMLLRVPMWRDVGPGPDPALVTVGIIIMGTSVWWLARRERGWGILSRWVGWRPLPERMYPLRDWRLGTRIYVKPWHITPSERVIGLTINLGVPSIVALRSKSVKVIETDQHCLIGCQ